MAELQPTGNATEWSVQSLASPLMSNLSLPEIFAFFLTGLRMFSSRNFVETVHMALVLGK